MWYVKPGCPARITPAHAGKSDFDTLINKLIKDHPRTCGEKGIWLLLTQEKLGSPPHMRGKDDQGFALYGKYRITPAHAGKSPAVFDFW